MHELTIHIKAQDVVDELLSVERGMLKSFAEGDTDVLKANAAALEQKVSDLGTFLANKHPGVVLTRGWLDATGDAGKLMIEAGTMTFRDELKLTGAAKQSGVEFLQRQSHNTLAIQQTLDEGTGAGDNKAVPAVTQREAWMQIKETTANPTEAAKGMKNNDDMTMMIMLDPKAKRDVRLRRARHLYNPQDSGFLVNVETDQQQGMYNKRYNPTVSLALRDLNDRAVVQQYKFNAKGDLAMLATGSRRRLASYANPLVTVSIDPKTELLVIEEHGSSPDEIGFGGGHEGDAAVIREEVKGFNQMALQFKATMEALGDGDEGAFADDEPITVMAEFYRDVAGVSSLNTDGATDESVHVRLVKEAQKNTNPAALGDPQGLALLNTGRSEGDDNPPPREPNPRENLSGVSDDPGSPNSSFRIGLGDTELPEVVRKVFSGDTSEVDDSVVNSRVFESLLKGDGKFPEVANQGSGFQKFITDLDAFIANPLSGLTGREKQALIEWVTTVRGPEPGVVLPDRKPLEVPDRKPTPAPRSPSDLQGEDFEDADHRIPVDTPVPHADLPEAPPLDKAQNNIIKADMKDSPPLPERKPVAERNLAVKDVQVEALSNVLTFIAKGEGGYDSSNNGTLRGRIVASTHNSKPLLGKPLAEHTIGEIMKLQQGTRGSGRKLFAVGRYQIIPNTMPGALKESGLSKSDLFSEENQDKLGIALIMGSKRPKLAGYIRGKHNNLRLAMLDFAREWASLPHPDTGNSVYGSGNRSSHSRASVKAALIAARASFADV